MVADAHGLGDAGHDAEELADADEWVRQTIRDHPMRSYVRTVTRLRSVGGLDPRRAVHVEQFTQGPDSLVGVLKQFQQVLKDADAALELAVRRYEEAEQDAVETLTPWQE